MRVEHLIKHCIIRHIFNDKCVFVALDEFVKFYIDTNKLEKLICPYCGRKFPSPQSLTSHLFNKHHTWCAATIMMVIHKIAEEWIKFRQQVSEYHLRRNPHKIAIQYLYNTARR